MLGCAAPGMLGCAATGMLGCAATGEQGCAATGVQGCAATGVQGCAATGMQDCAAPGVIGCTAKEAWVCGCWLLACLEGALAMTRSLKGCTVSRVWGGEVPEMSSTKDTKQLEGLMSGIAGRRRSIKVRVSGGKEIPRCEWCSCSQFSRGGRGG